MSWDYFISHASEDKSLIVAPFAHYLQAARFKVWYDDFSLKVGDSLMQSIAEGLRHSKFGVVVLSPAFFKKHWPQQELAALYSLESSGNNRILPVWHRVSSKDITQYSLFLADRKAADTRKGLQSVAEEIVAASFPDRIDNLPLSSVRNTEREEQERAKRVLSKLLKGAPSTDDIFLFISGYPILLENLVGHYPVVIPGFKLPSFLRVDFAVFVPYGVSGPIEVLFVVLGPVDYDHSLVAQIVHEFSRSLGSKKEIKRYPRDDSIGAPYFGQFSSLTRMGNVIQDSVRSANIHWSDPKTWSFQLRVITGRRSETPREQRGELVKHSWIRVDIASYDRLLDNRRSMYDDISLESMM